MASLVADYGSDDDSEQESEEVPNSLLVQAEEAGAAGVNYLIPADEEDSDSSDSKTELSKESLEKLPNPIAEKLPAPKLRKIKKKDKNIHVTAASVFTNQFEKAEQAKQSLLEKHVKMTEGENPSGKKTKICKKFKQGKCRFEKNCKYSHNLDSNLSLRYIQEDAASSDKPKNEMRNKNYPQLPPPPKQRGFMGTLGTLKQSSGPRYTSHQMRNFREQERHMGTPEEDEDDRGIAEDKRKKRIGMSQSLVPPKKAMTSLNKQRMDERPWTFNKK